MTLPTFQARPAPTVESGKGSRVDTVAEPRCRACGCVGPIDDVSELDVACWRVWVLGGALLKAHLEDVGR